MANPGDLLRQARALAQGHQWQRAEDLYRQALTVEPGNVQLRDELAWLLLHAGQIDRALAEIQAAIQWAPRLALLHLHQGLMLSHAGRTPQAIACYQRAIELQPAEATAHFNLGNAWSEVGNYAAAAESYRQAAVLLPDDADIFLNQGIALRALGQFDEARTSLARAVELKPHSPDGWINLGVLARTCGDDAEAERCYRQALSVDPACARAYNNLGSLAQSQFRSEQAVEYIQRALQLQPNYPLARANLGDAYLALSKPDEARAAYVEVLTRGRNDAVEIKHALVLPAILMSHETIADSRCQLAAGLEYLRARPLTVTDPVENVGLPAFYLAYQGFDERDTQRQISEIVRRATPGLSFVAPHCRSDALPASRPRRIGFISRHFFDHTIAKLNRGLIQLLDRQQFHVTLLRFPGRNDAVAQALDASADTTVTLSTRLPVAQQQIAQCELDLLFYTDIGMDALTYYLAHARLAPVQCVTWGHPLTTGIATVDYFISSDDLELPGSTAHYTESLVRLPHLANYYYRPEPPATASRAAWGFAEQDHLYACPQSLFKLHPDDDTVFGQILRADPRARIVLIEGQQAAWTGAIRARQRQTLGSLSERVCFVPRMPQQQFQQLLTAVDVMLDPLHFGGGNSSYEAFSVGAPVVTLPGPLLRSRITYALYRAMGIDAAVARDIQDYASRAVRLGTDRAWREEVRGQILAGNHHLYESRAGIAELEHFLAAVSLARSAGATSLLPKSRDRES